MRGRVDVEPKEPGSSAVRPRHRLHPGKALLCRSPSLPCFLASAGRRRAGRAGDSGERVDRRPGHRAAAHPPASLAGRCWRWEPWPWSGPLPCSAPQPCRAYFFLPALPAFRPGRACPPARTSPSWTARTSSASPRLRFRPRRPCRERNPRGARCRPPKRAVSQRTPSRASQPMPRRRLRQTADGHDSQQDGNRSRQADGAGAGRADNGSSGRRRPDGQQDGRRRQMARR